MNRRIKFLLPLLLILIAAGTAGYVFWQRTDSNNTGDTLTLHGNVDIRQVQLAFNGNERISDMRFQEGDRVNKGDLLASLDKTRLQHAADEAAARVAVTGAPKEGRGGSGIQGGEPFPEGVFDEFRQTLAT